HEAKQTRREGFHRTALRHQYSGCIRICVQHHIPRLFCRHWRPQGKVSGEFFYGVQSGSRGKLNLRYNFGRS
ncbi:unnamed protein product, partial [Ascophyllum nodosum]